MMATLLLPAGVTSETSIKYKDEAEILGDASGDEADLIYIEKILPEKMKYNLDYINGFLLFRDIKICFSTVINVIK